MRYPVRLWSACGAWSYEPKARNGLYSQFGSAGAPGIAVGLAPGVATRFAFNVATGAVAAFWVMDASGTALYKKRQKRGKIRNLIFD